MRLNKIYLLLMVVLLFAVGCAGQKTETAPEAVPDKLQIVTSFYPMYIMTINIAKDIPGVEVSNMTKPQTGCLHDYQMTPDDMKTLQSAAIMVVNGAGMESFLQKVIDQQPQLKMVQASEGLSLLTNQSDGEPNPHLWVSISGAIAEVANIGRQLAILDPAHGAAYQRNTAAYLAKLEALRSRMHLALDQLPNRKIITFHEAFPYFAREFGLDIVAVVEREPGAQPSAGELARTIDLVNQTGVKAIFAEPQYPVRVAQTIARETGAKVFFLDPAVTGEMDPDAYLKTMTANLQTLEEALR